ncbi:MAG TPA: hypothetical protein PLG04_02355 [Anaerolineaceae bacterium]|nr:hypothetical protein [Anaerolineaceae bacterium]
MTTSLCGRLLRGGGLFLLPTLFFGALFLWRYVPYFSGLDDFIIGDLTDGYFNLWVMEHTRHLLATCALSDYIQTRFFAPEGQLVLFWSDSLILPAIMYLVFCAFGAGKIVAFNLTVLTLIFSAFWIFYYFFETVYECAIEANRNCFSLPRPLVCLMVSLLACMVAFSDSRLALTIHFQNQMMNLLLLGFSAILRYVVRPSSSRLLLVLSCWVFLCYSTPYYAVMYAILTAVAVLLYAYIWPEGRGTLIARWWYFVLAGVLAMPIGCGYLLVRSPYHSQSEFSSRVRDIILPDGVTGLGGWLRQHGLAVPYHSPESLSYIGILLLPSLCVVFAWFAVRRIRIRGGLATGGWMALLLISSGVWYWAAAFGYRTVAVTSIVATLCTIIVLIARGACLTTLPGRLLVIAAVICYGTALGPVGGAPVGSIDPSVWGILAKVVPGYDSIRAVGRFGALGGVFLIGAGWWCIIVLLRSERVVQYRLVMAVCFAVILFTILFDSPRAPYVNRYDFNILTPKPEERAFYMQADVRILVLPPNNLSLIPGYMIYFEGLDRVQLVNGYSGRFSSLIESLQVPDDQLTTVSIKAAITSSGVTHLLLDKRAYGRDAMTRLAEDYGGTLKLETSFYQLLSLPTRAAGISGGESSFVVTE